jgi:hypothetical protein
MMAHISTERQAGISRTEQKLPELAAKIAKTENTSTKQLQQGPNFERIQLREQNMFSSVRVSKSTAPVARPIKVMGASVHGGSLLTTHLAGLKQLNDYYQVH